MNVRFTISAELDVPENISIGQVIIINGTVTVDQLEAELVDTSTTCRDQWSIGRIMGRAFGNNLKVTA